MKMTDLFLKSALILGFSTAMHVSALAGENTLGLLSEEVNSAASSEVAQWGKMAGNWQVVATVFDQDGQVTGEIIGEWNWSYILNGHAIQDVYIVPGREEQTDASLAYFYDTNIRSFNYQKKKWDVAWINTRHEDLQLWEAEQVNDTMVMRPNRPYMDAQVGEGVIRIITFYNMTETHFSWKEDRSEDGGETWFVSIKIEGTKVAD